MWTGFCLLCRGKEVNANQRLVEAALRKCRVPVILIEHYLQKAPCDFMAVDNVKGGYLAAEYLLEKKDIPGSVILRENSLPDSVPAAI